MPITYNGVGTRYHGQRNLEKRTAGCRSCGSVAQLSSYDTRLWFVVIFIPLGRKRIIDECSACRRHFVVDADKWETQKQLGISGATEKYEQQPTPEAAMELHQTMLNFHQGAQAAALRRDMVEKFSDNAHVHAYLGEALSQAGNAAEGETFFDRAPICPSRAWAWPAGTWACSVSMRRAPFWTFWKSPAPSISTRSSRWKFWPTNIAPTVNTRQRWSFMAGCSPGCPPSVRSPRFGKKCRRRRRRCAPPYRCCRSGNGAGKISSATAPRDAPGSGVLGFSASSCCSSARALSSQMNTSGGTARSTS